MNFEELFYSDKRVKTMQTKLDEYRNHIIQSINAYFEGLKSKYTSKLEDEIMRQELLNKQNLLSQIELAVYDKHFTHDGVNLILATLNDDNIRQLQNDINKYVIQQEKQMNDIISQLDINQGILSNSIFKLIQEGEVVEKKKVQNPSKHVRSNTWQGSRVPKNQKQQSPNERLKQILKQGQCGHKEKCNTLIHFQCCKQYFPCHFCHKEKCQHEAYIVKPSNRKCMLCGSVFQVPFPTNQPINCNNCVEQMIILLQD